MLIGLWLPTLWWLPTLNTGITFASFCEVGKNLFERQVYDFHKWLCYHWSSCLWQTCTYPIQSSGFCRTMRQVFEYRMWYLGNIKGSSAGDSSIYKIFKCGKSLSQHHFVFRSNNEILKKETLVIHSQHTYLVVGSFILRPLCEDQLKKLWHHTSGKGERISKPLVFSGFAGNQNRWMAAKGCAWTISSWMQWQ